MKLSSDASITREKIANYLLIWRPENDKSQFLAQAGYTQPDADRLAKDIREQLLSQDAQFEKTTEYGEIYRIVSQLRGPNGQTLRVVSIWMIEAASGVTKFITLYRAKED